MPSAVVSLVVTIFDHNGFLNETPMISILRLFKMPHLVISLIWFYFCFTVLPCVAAWIDRSTLRERKEEVRASEKGKDRCD